LNTNFDFQELLEYARQQLVNNNPIDTFRTNATLDFAGGAVGRPWYKSDYNNFAPRFGFAYAPMQGTVIRGAYLTDDPGELAVLRGLA